MRPLPPRLHRQRRMLFALSSVVLCALALVGCAVDDGGETGGIPDGFPTIAAPDFHGTFEVHNVVIGGTELEPGEASTRRIRFDVVSGAVEADLGCGRWLGSFTLAESGRASITLTGRIEIEPCEPSDVDDTLRDLLDRVERWEAVDDGFRLLAAGGDGFTLLRI